MNIFAFFYILIFIHFFIFFIFIYFLKFFIGNYDSIGLSFLIK